MLQQATTGRLDSRERIRQVGVGIFSGGVAGLIVGIGARITMRIVALTIHQVPVLTLATLSMLFMGLLLGICPSILSVIVRKYLPGPGPLRALPPGEPFASGCTESLIARLAHALRVKEEHRENARKTTL